MTSAKSNILEISHEEAKKLKDKKVFGLNANGYLEPKIDEGKAYILWLMLFGPVFYLHRGLLHWFIISIAVLIWMIQSPDFISIASYFGCIAFPRKKIMNFAYKRSGSNPISIDNAIYYASPQQKDRIIQLGVTNFFDEQRQQHEAWKNKIKKDIEDKEEQKNAQKEMLKKEAEAKAHAEFLENKQKLIQKIQKKIDSAHKVWCFSFKFDTGRGFEVYPEYVHITAGARDSKLETLLDKAVHARNQSVVSDLKSAVPLFKESETLVVSNLRSTFLLEIDDYKYKVKDVVSIEMSEKRQILRAEEVKTKLVTTTATANDLFNFGKVGVNVGRSVSEVRQEVTKEEGLIICQINVILIDGRQFSAYKYFGTKDKIPSYAYYFFKDVYAELRAITSSRNEKA